MELYALRNLIVLAAGEAAPPAWFLVFPAGEVQIQDDRPAVMDEAGASQIMADFAATSVDMVVDYEHQTLTGDKAPAAGWVKEFKWDLAGLWARVEWTDIAAAHIKSREYRYFSPTFLIEKTSRRIVRLYNIALTNQPRMMNIQALAAKLAPEGPGRKDNPMFDKLKTLLGLAPTASEDEVAAKAEAGLTELQTLKTKKEKPVVACKEVLDAVGATDQDDAPAVVAKVAALKTGKSAADADFQALKADHEALKKSLATRDAGDVVTAALNAGKITPAQSEWAKTYALKDPAGFAAFVAAQPQVVPLKDLPPKKDDGSSLSGDPAERLSMLAAKTMKDDPKLGLADAQNLVLKQNPALAEEYFKASRGGQA